MSVSPHLEPPPGCIASLPFDASISIKFLNLCKLIYLVIPTSNRSYKTCCPLSQKTSASINKTCLSSILEVDVSSIVTITRGTADKDEPLLVVACGRDTISIASSIKRLTSENVFVVQIQHPRRQVSRFDLVFAPQHDYYALTPHAQEYVPEFLRKYMTPDEPPSKNVVDVDIVQPLQSS